MRKILPFILPWPPASWRPPARSSSLSADQSVPSGTRAEVTVFGGIGRVGEEVEAHGREAGPGGGAAGGMAGDRWPHDPRPP